jgi:hypothetical protein
MKSKKILLMLAISLIIILSFTSTMYAQSVKFSAMGGFGIPLVYNNKYENILGNTVIDHKLDTGYYGLGISLSFKGYYLINRGTAGGVGIDIGYNAMAWTKKYKDDVDSDPDYNPPSVFYIYGMYMYEIEAGPIVLLGFTAGLGLAVGLETNNSNEFTGKAGFGFKGGMWLGFAISDEFSMGVNVEINYAIWSRDDILGTEHTYTYLDLPLGAHITLTF